MVIKKFKSLALATAIATLMASGAYAAPVDNISTDNMFNHLNILANVDNARTSGYEGEHRAADYIFNEYQKYGLKPIKQKFSIRPSVDINTVACTITSPENKVFKVKTFDYAPATLNDGVKGEVIYAGLGTASDFQKVDVKGKIALIERGSLSFYDKTQNAAKAGAIGAIIYNNESGELSGTLKNATDIPVIAMTAQDGKYLKGLKNTKVTIKYELTSSKSYSENVIGTLKSDNPNAKTIVIGAHCDCVDTPGANDNCSGTVALLELARVLSTEKLNYNINFVSFGAEELGLLGSQQYIKGLSKTELNKIHCMINLDMVGVGDTLGICTSKDGAKSFIADMTEQYAKKDGIKYRRWAIDRSDHAPFEQVGIPVSFLMYEQDTNYHTDQDSIDKIQKEDLNNSAKIVVKMISDMSSKVPTAYEMLDKENIKLSAENKQEIKLLDEESIVDTENNYDISKLDNCNFENTEIPTE